MPGGEHDGEEIIHQAVFHPDLFRLRLKIDDMLRAQYRLNFVGRVQQLGAIQHFLFLIRSRIADAKSHEESVELRFRKREGAVILCRVLCGDDHKRLLKGIGLVVDGDLGFAHRFEEAALSLRRGAVDFVGQDDVGKQRARHELKRLFLAIEHGNADDIGGQQVASELNTFEGAIEGAREAMGQRGLPDTGDVLDQEMATCQQADDRHLDHLWFPFNDLRDIVL